MNASEATKELGRRSLQVPEINISYPQYFQEAQEAWIHMRAVIRAITYRPYGILWPAHMSD